MYPESLKLIDQRLWKIQQALAPYDYINPVNGDAEKARFLEHIEQGNIYNPQFEYQSLAPIVQEAFTELCELQKELEDFPDSELIRLYKADVERQIKFLILAQNREPMAYTQMSKELFGVPSQGLLAIASDILTQQSSTITQTEDKDNEKSLTAEDFRTIIEEELRRYNLIWNIEMTDHMSARVSVRSANRSFKINVNAHFSRRDVERLKIHEIGTHMFRAENGRRQPLKIFVTGVANYLPTEEGLAMVMEEQSDCLYPRTLKICALRVIAIDAALSSSFYETYQQLLPYTTRGVAYKITQRVKRGLEDTEREGGYTKDLVYLSGRQAVQKYADVGSSLELLFVGKIALEQVPDIQRLLNARVLQPPLYLPPTLRA